MTETEEIANGESQGRSSHILAFLNDQILSCEAVGTADETPGPPGWEPLPLLTVRIATS